MTRCPNMSDTGTGCNKCGAPLKGRRTRWCSNTCSLWHSNNHRYTQARRQALRGAATYQCAHCKGHTTAPEVNHIIPCKGKHGVTGCHHHQDNLEVLCHECHLKATAAQRAAGHFAKKASVSNTR